MSTNKLQLTDGMAHQYCTLQVATSFFKKIHEQAYKEKLIDRKRTFTQPLPLSILQPDHISPDSTKKEHLPPHIFYQLCCISSVIIIMYFKHCKRYSLNYETRVEKGWPSEHFWTLLRKEDSHWKIKYIFITISNNSLKEKRKMQPEKRWP